MVGVRPIRSIYCEHMTPNKNTQSDEIWEAVGAGAVWVTLTDDRGRDVQRQIGGPGGSSRMRIKTVDREAMQYASEGNPFDSGRLRRVDGEYGSTSQIAKTDAELLALLGVESLSATLMAESELNVRRLYAMAESDSASRVTVSQLHDLKSVIQARWPQPEPPADQLAAAYEK